jgi:2-keto-4-pentenoate hydratase
MNTEAARRLAMARSSGRPCAPVRDLLAPGDIAGAYAIQAAWVARQVAGGARLAGRKIGLTNPAVQAQLGVGQPDFGTLLDTMNCPAGEPVDIGRTLQPKIEAEVAFVLARDLTAAETGPDEVAAATAYLAPALEIVDSRIAGWDISIVDTVADNASSGLFTIGAARRAAGEVDLAGCVMTMWRGGEVVSAGTGAACLGSPLAAVAWLAATAREYGAPLRAGEVILSGALGPMVAVAPGDRFRAEITGLGLVDATFTAAAAGAGRQVPAPAGTEAGR